MNKLSQLIMSQLTTSGNGVVVFQIGVTVLQIGVAIIQTVYTFF